MYANVVPVVDAEYAGGAAVVRMTWIHWSPVPTSVGTRNPVIVNDVGAWNQ